MDAPAKSRKISSRESVSRGAWPKQFANELKPSLRLPEFVSHFTLRAGQLLGARNVVLGLAHGKRLETVLANEVNGKKSEQDWQVANDALNKLAERSSAAMLQGNAKELLGESFREWRQIWFLPLTGTEGDLLGALCLVDCARKPNQEKRKLLEMLASHASIALENSRLFSRIEHSKRQWVEDFDSINDLIIVHDPANIIIRANRSLAGAVGSVPSELVGKSTRILSAITPNASSDACPFCQETERAGKDAVLNAGARSLLISTSRIGGGSDEGSRTIHVLKDITEQRQYQMQLQRERDFNTKILNSTQSMILVLDTAGLVSYANRRCYESGYNKESLVGCKFADLIPPPKAVFEKAFESAVRGIAAENMELSLQRGNRSTGRFSITLSPMRDERGRVNSIIVVVTDITDAAVLQAQLRHSEKMAALGQLVSGVAHEINNPLAAIVGYSDLLLEETNTPEESKEELRIISTEAERAREIVQNLLRFARQMPTKREVLDIHSVLRQVLQLRTYGAAGDRITVIERFGESLSPICGDAQQLQQVFLNILNNAYDAVHESEREGRIEIETHQRNGRVEVLVRDNGIGISDPTRIFEPFYTTKEVGKGTGLGLSICYGIIREHGGDISCRNNADVEGCTFIVQLPMTNNRGEDARDLRKEFRTRVPDAPRVS